MRFKDTIKTAKKARKDAKMHPDHYTEDELLYLLLMEKSAKLSLKKKKKESKKPENMI
jgi:hypothetical protein